MKEYETTHPWITFQLDLNRFSHKMWMALKDNKSIVERDIDDLENMGLLEKDFSEKKESRVRAAKNTILAFLPVASDDFLFSKLFE